MTKIYKCTLKSHKGYLKQSFYIRGTDAIEVASKIQIQRYCDGIWDIENMTEENLIEDGLDFWAHYGATA